MKWAEVSTFLLLLNAAFSFEMKKDVRSFGRLYVSESSDDSFSSVAVDWAKEQEELTEGNSNKKRKKFVVIGGGWGGWGAAKALCQSGIDADVTLIDALPDPTGVSMIQQACDDWMLCISLTVAFSGIYRLLLTSPRLENLLKLEHEDFGWITQI
jgi:rhodanese-related sulfurtransferase